MITTVRENSPTTHSVTSFLYFVSIEVGGVAIFEINYYCKRSVVRLIPVQSQTANKGTQTYAPQSRCTA